MSGEKKILRVSTGGRDYDLETIRLFPEFMVLEARRLAAAARERLSSFSTGLGLWGSPEWVIGGTLVLGAIEAIVGDKRAKEGIDMLREAARVADLARIRGLYFESGAITNIETANPLRWRILSEGLRQYDTTKIAEDALWSLLGERQAEFVDQEGSILVAREPMDFVVLEDEFITAADAVGSVLLRWTSVDACRLVDA